MNGEGVLFSPNVAGSIEYPHIYIKNNNNMIIGPITVA